MTTRLMTTWPYSLKATKTEKTETKDPSTQSSASIFQVRWEEDLEEFILEKAIKSLDQD